MPSSKTTVINPRKFFNKIVFSFHSFAGKNNADNKNHEIKESSKNSATQKTLKVLWTENKSSVPFKVQRKEGKDH